MAADSFTLLTYNIWNHHEGEAAFEHRAQLVALAIAEVAADVVCLQEVPSRTFVRQLMAFLSRKQGRVVRGATTELVRPDGWREHLAILHAGTGQVATPIAAPKGHHFGIAVALAQPRLVVINTHLDPHSSEARHSQAQLILKSLAFEGPTLLCGDLNAVPGGKTLAALETRFTRLAPVEGPTFATGLRPEVEARATLDHILGFGIEVEEQGLVGAEARAGTWPSDHAGVWARLRLA